MISSRCDGRLRISRSSRATESGPPETAATTVPSSRSSAASAATRRSGSSMPKDTASASRVRGQPQHIAQDPLPMHRQDRLGVELHAPGGGMPVGYGHDHRAMSRDDLEVGRHPERRQRMIPADVELLWHTVEEGMSVVPDAAGSSVHDLAGGADLAA